MTSVPTIHLNDGTSIPQLGFGTYQIEPADTTRATLDALEVGYRHIDTAEMYGNEKEVGDAIRSSSLQRDEVFVTSKLNNCFQSRDEILGAFDRSMKDLDIGHLDLFLIHWPLPTVRDYVAAWKVMQELHDTGQVRSIGVSNFQRGHLEKLFAETGTVPSVNQIEVHPYLVQDELRAFGTEHGIATEAWSPIAQGKVLDDAVIIQIADAHGQTPAQVTLRWHIQRGDIVFPKSVTPSRVEENFALFDFELSDADVAAITALDRGERIGPDPDTFDYVPS